MVTRKYVYILKAGSYYKIGIAVSVEERLSSIGVSSPLEVKLFKKWLVTDAQRIEKSLHRRFRSRKTNGEWFKLIKEDLLEIDKYFTKRPGGKRLYKLREDFDNYHWGNTKLVPLL